MQTFFLGKQGKENVANNTAGSLETSFSENVAATFNNFVHNKNSIAFATKQGNRISDQFRLARSLGIDISPNPFRASTAQNERGQFRSLKEIRAQNISDYNATIIAERTADPSLNLKTIDEFREEIFAEQREIWEQTKDIQRRADGVGIAGQFLGEIGGAFTDPINIAAVIIAAPLAAESIIGTFFFEAAVGGLSESLIQLKVNPQLKEAGIDPDEVDAETKAAILGAGIGGGIFGVFLKSIGKGGAAVIKKFKNGNAAERLDAMAKMREHVDLTPEERTNFDILEEALELERDIADGNVLPDELVEHAARLQAAQDAISSGKIPDELLNSPANRLQAVDEILLEQLGTLKTEFTRFKNGEINWTTFTKKLRRPEVQQIKKLADQIQKDSFVTRADLPTETKAYESARNGVKLLAGKLEKNPSLAGRVAELTASANKLFKKIPAKIRKEIYGGTKAVDDALPTPAQKMSLNDARVVATEQVLGDLSVKIKQEGELSVEAQLSLKQRLSRVEKNKSDEVGVNTEAQSKASQVETLRKLQNGNKKRLVSKTSETESVSPTDASQTVQNVINRAKADVLDVVERELTVRANENIDLEIPLENGKTLKVKKILADIEKEKESIEVVKSCGVK